MEVAGVARKLDKPVWMNIKGDVVDESSAFGCRVTHELVHPD